MLKNSFFWEKGSRKRTKTRFNLLLLEYGEYFVDDVGVFQYPHPDDGSGRDFFQCDALKVQGRLKLCTKSFIFEPSDVRKPLLKFPFKGMSPAVAEYALSASQKSQCTIETSGFFTFACSPVFAMKDDGKIGPYRQLENSDPKEPMEYFFAVSHSHIGVLLTKIAQLRQLYVANERGELGAVSRLLADITSSGPTAVFDSSKLIDFHEKLRMELAMGTKKIKPLVDNPGYIMLTDQRLYFQPGQLNNVGEATQHYNLTSICRLYKRRYLLMDTALELIMGDGESVLFCFDNTANRDFIHDVVNSEPHLVNARVTLEEMTLKWCRREISNFDYLMFVNNEAGRSLSDLAQYPVYPHIIADYSSSSLDLSKAETFRDLSKPVGALNPQRLEFFKERMQSMPPEDKELGIPPRFLYGTHYSTPGYVLYYLVRVAPEHMLCLQSGKFDSTDRMFISLAETWESCLNNPADLKELIPEFFCGKSGEFLVNISELDLGRRQTGEKLHDVELPPWAKSPKDFIKKHTKALESEYVSMHLHKWIDLIFGAYQRGDSALEHDNLFYHLTYEGAVDMDKISDPRERRALEVQIQEFGQTPRQLFFAPHPQRFEPESNMQSTADHLKRGEPKHEAEGPLPGSEFVVSPSSNKKKGIDRLVYLPESSQEVAAIVINGSKEASSADASRTSHATDVAVRNNYAPDIRSDPEPLNYQESEEPKEVIELGEDFQEEVQRVLLAEMDSNKFVDASAVSEATAPKSNDIASPAKIGPRQDDNTKSNATPTSYFSSWVGSKIGNLWGSSNSTRSSAPVEPELGGKVKIDSISAEQSQERAISADFSAKQGPALDAVNQNAVVSPSPEVEGGRPPDEILIHSCEPFQAHSEPVTCVSISADGRTVISCSKDSMMKVLRVSTLEQAGPSSSEWNQISVRRSFTASDPPLSGCCILSRPKTVGLSVGDSTKFVLVSSWDSSIYSYSIPNACVVGQKVAHDDGISAIGCDLSAKKVVSGSWDASVKIWSVVQATGLLSTVPEVEFFDHDTPIQCVSINDTCRYVAAGAEDGRLCVWSLDKGVGLILQKQISVAGRSVSSVQWIHHGSKNWLLCCALDGNILCFEISDSSSAVVAAGQLDAGLKCLQCDPLGHPSGSSGFGIFAGFSDGSLRVLSMRKGKIIEVDKHIAIHHGGINSLCLTHESGDLVVSGGEDGCIRVWDVKTLSPTNDSSNGAVHKIGSGYSTRA